MFIQMSYFSMWLIILKKGKENPKLNELNDFEQLLYLFENNEKNDILKSKERLVKVFVDKYEEMQKDDELWSTAMAIQMGEARYRYGLEDSFEEGKKEGEALLLIKQLKSKYHEDCTTWLQSLNDEQIEAVSSLILVCNSFQELKDQVMSMK